MNKKIAVVGSSHLATVITGCLIDKKYEVIVVDEKSDNFNKLQNGNLPIFEPDLQELITKGINQKKLSFSTDFENAFRNINVIYFAKDAIKTKDGVDLDDIYHSVKQVAGSKQESFVMIISTQLPVGTIDKIKTMLNSKRIDDPIHFAIVPEFLRLGNAVSLFMNQDYTIIGCDTEETFNTCYEIFNNFSNNIFRMAPIEAEIAKHIANIFVATSVSFISEITKVADHMGIDLRPVSKALRHDKRIGPKSYIYPGLGFTGGNLERDIKVIQGLLKKFGETSDFMDTIVSINDHHNKIVHRQLEKIFKTFKGLNVAFLGITYKSFTNTLTGSLTLSIATELLKKGCIIKAFDPLVSREESYLHNGIIIASDVDKCIEGCDALIIMIEKPEFKKLTVEHIKNLISKKVIIDAANMLNADEFIQEGFQYAGIGTGYSF